MKYVAKQYWDERFKKDLSIASVGNASYGMEYNRWMYKRKDDCQEIIFYGVKLCDKNVLDVGCGIGHWLGWFKGKHVRTIAGVDISSVAIDGIRKMFPVWQDVKLFNLDIVDSYPEVNDLNGFDIVNAWDILPHIVDDDDAIRALQNMHSCLAYGGWLVISDQFGRKYSRINSEHVHVRSISFYDGVMENIGFRHIKPIYPVFKNLNYDKTTPAIDNNKGYDYYLLDSKLVEPSEDNTSVTVFQKTKE